MIRSALIFILVTVSLYLLAIGVLTNVNYESRNLLFHGNNYYPVRGGNVYRKFTEYDRNRHYDIICVGASRCYRVYDTELLGELGYDAFNLASYSQTVENTYHIINEYVAEAHPGCVIYDLADITFSTEIPTLEADLDLVMNSLNAKVPTDILLRNPDVRIVNTYMSRLFFRNSMLNPSEKNYKKGGYCSRTDSLPHELCEQMSERSSRENHELVWLDERMLWLHKLITLCEQKNLKLIPVIGPVSSYYPEERTRTSHEKFERAFAAHGLHVYDFSDMPGINACDHFYDYGHMNQSGVNIFIPYLTKTLRDQLPTSHEVSRDE